MRKAKRVCRRALAVILSLTMLFTTFVCFDIGSLFSSAIDTSSAITVTKNNLKNVYFYAPEAIYLTPNLEAYSKQQSYSFQWFADSTVQSDYSAKLNTGEKSTGNIYFHYDDASKVSIMFRYLDKNMNEMTKFTDTNQSSTTADYANPDTTIKVAAYSTPLKPYNTNSVSSNTRYSVSSNTMNTTITGSASKSPYLLANSDGCFIEWTAEFVDKTDGITKSVKAYTYVFKPVIEPVGALTRTVNDRGTDSYGSNFSWLSGIHSITGTGGYYPKTAQGNRGCIPFSSSNPQGKVLGSAGKYMQYAAEIMDQSFFGYSASNTGCADWFSDSSASYGFKKSFNYVSNSLSGPSSGDAAFYTLATAPTSAITVDNSRYGNMNLIPNLTVGMMVTDDEASSSSGGAWYIADMTGKSDSSDSIKDYNKNNTTNALNLWNNHNGAFVSVGSYNSWVAGAESEGVRYNGPWVKATGSTSTTSTYKIRTGYFNHDSSSMGSYYGGDTIWNIHVIPVTVTLVNKATLRTAYLKAVNKAAQFGLKADGTSAFYNSSSADWQGFVSLYQAAGKLLAKLTGTQTVSATLNGTSKSYTAAELATALESQITKVSSLSKTASSATVRFLAATKQSDGTYTYNTLYDNASSSYAADGSKGYSFGDTVKFAHKEFTGYNYLGYRADLYYKDGSNVGKDYKSVVSVNDADPAASAYTTQTNLCYTFFYETSEYTSIVNPNQGEFNYLTLKTSDFPSELGGVGYPQYTATSKATDINYKVSYNDISVWTSSATTAEKYQFLPYFANLVSGTTYELTYDITGANEGDVKFSLYRSNFTGGNGSTSSEYVFPTSGSIVKTNAVDSGVAYLKIELLAGAKTGKEVMISNICLKKSDANALYTDFTQGYPAYYTPPTSDKTGISYNANGTDVLNLTTRFSSSMYDQRQLLPYYVELKPNSTYTFSCNVTGIDPSKVLFTLNNSSFSQTYSLANGKTFTVNSNDDGIAQLKIELGSGVPANTSITVSNLVIDDVDNRTLVSGLYHEDLYLGIPVREGFKFNGWSVKANDGTNAYGTITNIVPGLYKYTFGAGIDLIEANWTAASYRVVFRGEDGTVYSDQTVMKGSAAKTPDSHPEKFGHTFAGWDADYSKVTKNMIIEPKFDEIDITVNLNASTATVYSNENGTGKGFQLSATFNPDTTGISSISWTTNNSAIATVSPDGYVTGVAPGSAKITGTVTYDGRTYSSTCTVTVVKTVPTALKIDSPPTKTSYFVFDKFDYSGMKLKITYNSGFVSDPIDYDSPNLLGTVTLNNISSNTPGSKTLTVTYKEGSTTLRATTTLVVSEILLTSFTVTAPTKNTYYEGDLESEFNPDGMTLHLYYNNGTDEIVEYYEIGDLVFSGFNSSKAGTITMRATIGEVSTEFPITILPLELTSISVQTMPNKTSYFVGDDFDSIGLTIKASYNSGKTVILSNDFTLSGYDKTKAGKQTITVSYGGKTTTFTVDVVAVVMNSITIKQYPEKRSFFVGDEFDSTGLVLTATYNNGKQEDISTGYVCTGFNSSKAGIQNITVTYNGLTTTYAVSVNAVVVDSIVVKTNPTKTTYFVGETLDTTGLTLTATYNNGKTETITSGWTLGDTSLNAAGSKVITVNYGYKSTSFAVTVVSVVPTEISVKTAPTKVSYFEGEALNTAGLVLNVKYNNGTSNTVTSGFTTSGYLANKVGKQTVTVTYSGCTTTFDVEVIKIAISSISIKTSPDKTEYFTGDSLDTTGLSINLNYNNGTVTPATTGFTVSGYDKTKAGSQQITVTYSGFTTTFTVNVTQVVATGITISSEPYKIEYEYGDDLITNGLSLHVTYNNGTEKTVTTGFEVEGYDSHTIGNQTITVKYEGCEAYFDVTVILTVDLTEYNEAVEAARAAIATGWYTADSVQVLENAISTNNAVVATAKDQAIIDAATADVKSKTSALILADGDYSAVETAISNANTKIATGWYTDASVASLQSAIDAVVTGLYLKDQATIDNFAKDINAKIAKLVEKDADYSKIDELMAEFEALDPSNYTNYDEVYWDYVYMYYYVDIDEARYVYTKISQQAEVDALYDTLKSYCDMLEEIVVKEIFEAKEGSTTVIDEIDGQKYIFGLKSGLTLEELIADYVSYENVRIEVINSKSKRYIGTGSVIKVYSTVGGSEELVDEITVIIYGDCDGNGFIDAFDSTLLFSVAGDVVDPLEGAYAMAVNLQKDQFVDLFDAQLLLEVAAGMKKIDQASAVVE